MAIRLSGEKAEKHTDLSPSSLLIHTAPDFPLSSPPTKLAGQTRGGGASNLSKHFFHSYLQTSHAPYCLHRMGEVGECPRVVALMNCRESLGGHGRLS